MDKSYIALHVAGAEKKEHFVPFPKFHFKMLLRDPIFLQ